MSRSGGRKGLIARGFLNEMRMNLRSRDMKRGSGRLIAKLARSFVEHRDFLRRLHSHTLDVFPRSGRWNDDAFLQINWRLALYVIRMRRRETDFISHADPNRTRSMNGFAPRPHAMARNLRRQNPGVMVAIGNPVPIFAICRIDG